MFLIVSLALTSGFGCVVDGRPAPRCCFFLALSLSRCACSTQERKAARRELKNLAKTEAISEEEQAKKLAELELQEQEDLLHSQLSDTSQVV